MSTEMRRNFVFTARLAELLRTLEPSDRIAAVDYAIGYGLESVPASDDERFDQITREIDRANDRNTLATKEICEAVIGYLNGRCHTQYRANSQRTKGFLNARLREGFTRDDFFAVIDFKAAEWGEGSSMRQYLRPETLFGPKFEGYLQAARADLASRKPEGSFETNAFYEAALSRTYGGVQA